MEDSVKPANKIKIAMRDLENGFLVAGLRFYADRSRNYHKRILISKTVRAIERMSKEPFEDYQDLMRTYGTKGQGGRMTVLPAALDAATAADWKTKIEAWRNNTFQIDYDGLPQIVIELPEADLNEFPADCMEAILDYAEFKTIDSKGESETDKLRKKVEELTTKVASLQGPAEPGQ